MLDPSGSCKRRSRSDRDSLNDHFRNSNRSVIAADKASPPASTSSKPSRFQERRRWHTHCLRTARSRRRWNLHEDCAPTGIHNKEVYQRWVDGNRRPGHPRSEELF